MRRGAFPDASSQNADEWVITSRAPLTLNREKVAAAIAPGVQAVAGIQGSRLHSQRFIPHRCAKAVTLESSVYGIFRAKLFIGLRL